MADEAQKPWYRRLWPLLVAAAGFVLGLLLLKGRSGLAGRDAAKRQAENNKRLAERLEDKDAARDAKLEAADAKRALAAEKVEDAHDRRVAEIESEADGSRRNLAARPGDLAGGLVDSLDRADDKLRKS